MLVIPMKSAAGRLLLYVITGVEVPVLASKQLFTRIDFQRNEGLEAANRRHSQCKKKEPPVIEGTSLLSVPAVEVSVQ